jgi:hypothetical protein
MSEQPPDPWRKPPPQDPPGGNDPWPPPGQQPPVPPAPGQQQPWQGGQEQGRQGGYGPPPPGQQYGQPYRQPAGGQYGQPSAPGQYGQPGQYGAPQGYGPPPGGYGQPQGGGYGQPGPYGQPGGYGPGPGFGSPPGPGPRPVGAQPKQGVVIALLAAAVLTIIGSVMTWATVKGNSSGFEVSVKGTDGQRDGKITIVAGIVTLAMAGLMLARRSGRWTWIVAIVMGAITTITAIVDVSDVSDADNELKGLATASVGAGLWLTLVAGIGILVAAILASRLRSGPT